MRRLERNDIANNILFQRNCMNKDNSNTSGTKSTRRFNEQVNVILLIMFLAVVVILSLRGCRTRLFDGSVSGNQSHADQMSQQGDSTQIDSLSSFNNSLLL